MNKFLYTYRGGFIQHHSKGAGWTLAELLIVVAIVLLILLVIMLSNWQNQINRGYDAKRKSDLNKISIALEDYYNDKNCYAPADAFTGCESTQPPPSGFSPYLTKVPCDPQTKQPYLYVPETSPCRGYRICTALKDASDPVITQIGCDPVKGCGWGTGYNYCLSSGTSVLAPGFIAGGGSGAGSTSTPTPWPTGGPPSGENLVACTAGGDCNSFSDPPNQGCPVWWQDACPPGACGIVKNRCP